MFSPTRAFSGYSVDDEANARRFYGDTLGLHVVHEGAGLWVHVPDHGRVFIYPKSNHEPASFTVLNFVVDNIDAAVDELSRRGVQFERYEGIPADAKGIVRGNGPDIAWFKDPAGNILAVLEETS
jgi:catechol 2,3-dioxygenase-like lactoylglutathione lyase family enzyme